MKVLLAVDESPFSEEAINEVGERTWQPDTTVRVLHVQEAFVPPAQELWHDAGGDIERAKSDVAERNKDMLERTATWLREQGLNAETVIRDGDPSRMIVEEAKDWGADLIVVGSHGYSGIKRLLLGSVAQAVVDHAPCPVEVVHRKETGETGDGE